jgi:hypothetical protein
MKILKKYVAVRNTPFAYPVLSLLVNQKFDFLPILYGTGTGDNCVYLGLEVSTNLRCNFFFIRNLIVLAISVFSISCLN